MWKAIGGWLYERVWKSWEWTLAGIALGAAVEGLDVLTGTLTKAHPSLAPTLAGLSVIVGSILRSQRIKALAKAKDELAAAVSPPSTPPVALLLLLCAGLSAPGLVRADSPLYGGCLANQTTCFAPSVSLSLVSVSLQDGSVTTGVAPGVGYGMTLHADRWYQFGAAGYVSFRDTATGQAIVPSLVLSFANYARLGLGIQVGKGNKPFLLLGIGSDFGSAPSK